MSKENQANNVIQMWQQYLQDCMKDPKVAELTMDNYEKFANTMQGIFEKVNHAQSAPNDDSNGAVQLNELTARIGKLEARIELLEKYIARLDK